MRSYAPSWFDSNGKKHDVLSSKNQALCKLKERLLIIQAQVSVASPWRYPSYKKLTIDKMEKAIEAINRGTLSVRWAAEVYRIPKSALHNQISGKLCKVYPVDQNHYT